MTFNKWLAGLLGQNTGEIDRLMRNTSALNFLIAWSLFEAKCFGGYVRVNAIRDYAEELVSEGFRRESINQAVSVFHERYQDPIRYRNLIHRNDWAEFRRLTDDDLRCLSDAEALFYVTFVIYRYRNNMFHGNKGIASWLDYREQIELCTSVMQLFVTHAESLRPTLPERAAA